MRKRVLSLFLALALSVGLAVPAVAAESGFADVDPNAYYAEAVAWAVENNITSGTSATTFSPDQTCTRAQIATFIWRAKGSPEPGDAYNYTASDIPENAYYAAAVRWLVAPNYRFLVDFDGWTESGKFRPDDPCTRLEAVEFLYAVYGQRGQQSHFSDVEKNNLEVNWAVSWGITTGTSETTFSPDAVCTRGQIVTFLRRASLQTFVDIVEMTGTYVLERNPQYELVFYFNNPKAGLRVNNRKYGVTAFEGGFKIWSNFARCEDSTGVVTLIAFPDGLYLDFFGGYEYLNDLYGGKYIDEQTEERAKELEEQQNAEMDQKYPVSGMDLADLDQVYQKEDVPEYAIEIYDFGGTGLAFCLYQPWDEAADPVVDNVLTVSGTHAYYNDRGKKVRTDVWVYADYIIVEFSGEGADGLQQFGGRYEVVEEF